VYTEKIDCFSFGVIAIQIMTRLFPQPGDRQKDTGILARKITERERRQNHISKIDSSHPLLAIALNCLKDKDVERPSALEICKFLATLKKNSDYSESVRLADDTARQEHDIQKLREQQEEEIQQLEREKAREIEELERQLEEIKAKKAKAQERLKELESQL
jgi:DNA anti-recombination protein RmuC